MEYRVLSPWAEVDDPLKKGLKPRLKSLGGKTIGLFAYLKEQSVLILREIEHQLKEKYPTAQFSLFQYTKDGILLTDIGTHDEVY